MESARLITSSTSTDSNLKRRSSSSSYSPKSPSISDLPNRIDNVGKDTSLTLSLSGIFRSSENTPVSSGPGDVRRGDKALRKTVDEVWGEIVAGRREKKRIKGEKRNCKVEPSDANEFMTLEDFLAKADAAEKDNVKLERFYSDGGAMFGYDQGMIMSERSGVEESGGGKGNRSVMLEPLDKVAQQRQRRMIKNRESAARSRERKQAYQVELESMVVKLEEENELLLKEKEERIKERFKQLMEKIIPVVEKRKPQCSLRRVSSAQW